MASNKVVKGCPVVKSIGINATANIPRNGPIIGINVIIAYSPPSSSTVLNVIYFTTVYILMCSIWF